MTQIKPTLAKRAPRGREQARREWQGLTDKEYENLLDKVAATKSKDQIGDFARAIEAKLKEKNAPASPS